MRIALLLCKYNINNSDMDGISVKKLLIANGVDLNKHEYFDNTKKYGVNEIPNICVDKNMLKDKLMKNASCDIERACVEYVMLCVYPTNDDKIIPAKILNIFDNGC